MADSRFLDPNQTKPFFLNPYCHAEKLAVDIIIGCFYSNGIETALKLSKTTLITPIELDWVLGRVSYYYPELVEPLSNILTQPHVTNGDDLDTETLSIDNIGSHYQAASSTKDFGKPHGGSTPWMDLFSLFARKTPPCSQQRSENITPMLRQFDNAL